MIKTKMVMASILAVAVFSIAAAPLTQDAFADSENGKVTTSDGKAWGQATKNFAPLGDHSSSFDTPRAGLGNAVSIFGDGSWACLLIVLFGGSC